MSCSSSSNPSLGSEYITDPTPKNFILGSKRLIKIPVYQYNPDFAFDRTPSREYIVAPTTIEVVSATVDVYLSTDLTTIVTTGTPTSTDIIGLNDVRYGVELSYMFDTSIAPLNVLGEYICKFTYELDTGEIYVDLVYVNVADVGLVNDC